MSFSRLHSALQYHILNSLEWRTLRPLQEAAIGPILDGANVLLIAPTAGGKTEAAIFPVLSEILRRDLPAPSVLYVCPIRALLNNIEIRLGWYASLIGRTCALWHGDVSQADKSAVLRNPPDILLTTPESLEAMLVSTRVNKAALFSRIGFMIADELHAFGADDRVWHLLHILSRIRRISGIDAQRIGLSATVGEPDRLLQWFCGGSERPSQVVAPPTSGLVDAEVLIDYVGSVPTAAHVISHLHRGEKRLAFTDSRSQAEELASFLRGQGVETFISHSSLSRDERLRAEQAFQDARDCVIVATSTLELGIDVGDLDRVIQIDASTKVASFLQRLGRTGRRAGTHRVIERGAIPIPELGSFLKDYDGLLDCLLERGMLHQDGGLVSIGVPLRFTEGKLCDSQFGDPQFMFSTTDDRAFFVAAKVAQKIHGLRLKPGEVIDIVKAEVAYTNGRKGIEWQVSRVNPPQGEAPNPPVGEQPDGTLAVPASPSATLRIAPVAGQPGASVSAPAPVTAAPTSSAQPPINGNSSTSGRKAAERFWAGKPEAEQPYPQPPNGNNGSNGGNGHGNHDIVVADGRQSTKLEDALKTVVAAVHSTTEYAKSIGYAMPQFTSEDLRTMANTLMIAAKNGGN